MSSRYHRSTTPSNNPNDDRLDELLEDLQSTVARPTINGSATGNTGYKETYKSVSSQKNGLPHQTSTEYEVEYVNPSNSSSIASERALSPYLDKDMNGGISGKNTSYKTTSYEYSKKSGSHSGTPIMRNKFEKHNDQFESKFHENELHTFLSDLDHSHKSDLMSSSSNHISRFKNLDSGFLEPSNHSTPTKSSHMAKIEQKSFEEKRIGNSSPIRHSEVKKEVYYNGEPVEKFVDKYSSGNNEGKKDLIFTGGSLRHREPSPTRQLKEEVYHYETKSSSKKTSELPTRTVSRNYYESSDVADSAIPYTSDHHVTRSHEYNHSPLPIRNGYNYSNTSTSKEISTHRSPSPGKTYYSTTSTVTRNLTPQPTRATYESSRMIQETSSRKTTQRSPATPPPHRSPSPISFAQPPEPPLESSSSVKSYNFERSVGTPSPTQRFSPSEPSRETVPGQTVITRNYKYSSQSHQNTRMVPEPSSSYVKSFPSPSPQLEIKDQKPPKELDELMTSFSDSESQYRESYNRYNGEANRQPPKRPSPPKTPEKIIPIEVPQKLSECKKSNGVTGPAVYYPPGPLFTKKEECVISDQSAQGKGKMKGNRKAKYKYEAGSKTKDVSDTKKTVVPLCLPVCCALPCTIM